MRRAILAVIRSIAKKEEELKKQTRLMVKDGGGLNSNTRPNSDDDIVKNIGAPRGSIMRRMKKR